MPWLGGTWFGGSWSSGSWFGGGGGSSPPAINPVPIELYDPVPGNRGLRGPATLLLHFEEPGSMPPSDAAENLEDLQAESPVLMPSSVPAWSGRGRLFDSTAPNGLIAADRADRDTLLQRDITVQAIVALNLDASDTGYRTLISRGRAYRIAFAHTGSGSAVDVFWAWEDSSGGTHEQPAGTFESLGGQQLFLFTATRRWESSTKVVTRYYIDERLLAEHETADGDIGGSTTDATTIGARKGGLLWLEYFDGTIDELAVYEHEMSPDEVRAVWRRLYEHQPGGVETLRGLIPPGAPWMRDDSNKIGRRMKVVGQGLGSAAASIDELLELWLPDTAPRDQLTRWESVFGVSSRPRDSLDLRRSRLLGITGREEGFSIPKIREALATLLDVGDPAGDLQVIEGQNTIDDALSTIADERWLRGDLGTWAVVAGAARVTVPIASDVRWETARWGAHMRTSLDTGGNGPSFVAAKLATWSLALNAGAGLLLADRRTNSALWFGIYNDAGVTRLMYRVVLDGVAGALVDTGAAGAAPFWLRLQRPTTGLVGIGTYLLRWSTTSADAGFSEVQVTTGIKDPDWTGFGVVGTSSSLAAQLTMDFDDFKSFCPDGTRPHYWYVYRDPGLGGSPDIIGANKLIRRLKPAHTYAAVIESMSVLANNERYGLAGRGPMGVLHSL